jgi:GTP pyrophosphokinase
MSKRHHIPINPDEWIKKLASFRGENDITLLKQTIHFYAAMSPDLLKKGLGIADILFELGLDTETLSVALIYPAFQAEAPSHEMLIDKLGETRQKLLHDVLQMQSLGKLQRLKERNSQQTENLRKMLLAMVTDVRAVIIKLAERLWLLRQAKKLPQDEQEKLAQETLAIYAPLANRLGIWQLKWETEDLCMRYLQPETYSRIAKWLMVRRQEREEFIQRMITLVTDMLEKAHLKNVKVSGRVKHIYSINRKMERKNAKLEEIYDISALRVLVDNVEDCYTVLGLLQEAWPSIPEEFDDYIASPKANGYRSLHTVIEGPENRYIEIQIRTHQMHHESELGVAAHWRYKEGVLQTTGYEAKIALLRQIMAWQKEIGKTETPSEKPVQDIFADRIYVFTPLGDIIELPKDATPLDFAYTVHSEVGHRCRGAKVDGNIVPLTYALHMGQQVEILTGKQANPSRDWANPQHGFLKSSRARARVQHWFRVKDNLDHPHPVHEHETTKKEPQTLVAIRDKHHIAPVAKSNIQIVGMSNLLTNIARCCKPLPGDPIVGYITRARGVSIHKSDCGNMHHVIKNHHVRLIDVSWGEKQAHVYPVDLKLRIYDRPGLLRDITTTLANDKINVQGLQTEKISDSPEMDIYITIEISNVNLLNKAMVELKKISNVIDVKRR